MTIKELETWCLSHKAHVNIRLKGTSTERRFRVEASSHGQMTRLRTAREGADLKTTLKKVVDAHGLLTGMVPTI